MKLKKVAIIIAACLLATIANAFMMRSIMHPARAAMPHVKATPKAMPMSQGIPGYWQKVTGLPCAAAQIAPTNDHTTIPTMLVCKNGQMFVFRQQ